MSDVYFDEKYGCTGTEKFILNYNNTKLIMSRDLLHFPTLLFYKIQKDAILEVAI